MDDLALQLPEINKPHTQYGVGANSVSFIGNENRNKFREVFENLYKELDNEIYQTISKKKITNLIVELLRQLRSESRKCLESDIKKLRESFLAMEVKEFELFYPLYGFKLDIEELKLGSIWSVYNYKLSKDRLIHTYAHFSDRYIQVFGEEVGQNSDLILGIKLTCRDYIKAVELADEMVETFELVSSYMVGDVFHSKDFGVFKPRKVDRRKRLLCYSGSTGFNLNNYADDIENLTDEHFLCERCGNKRVWDLFCKKHADGKNVNELEGRIVRAVEWIGKGLMDSDLSRRFLQVAISIDSLVSTEGGGGEILSEYAGLILAQVLGEPDKIKGDIKRLYKLRTKVAHGSSMKVTIADLEGAYNYAKTIISVFLTDSDYVRFRNFNDI